MKLITPLLLFICSTWIFIGCGGSEVPIEDSPTPSKENIQTTAVPEENLASEEDVLPENVDSQGILTCQKEGSEPLFTRQKLIKLLKTANTQKHKAKYVFASFYLNTKISALIMISFYLLPEAIMAIGVKKLSIKSQTTLL